MNYDPNRPEQGIPISKKQPTAPDRPAPNRPAPNRPAPNRPAPNRQAPNRQAPNQPAPNQPAPDRRRDDRGADQAEPRAKKRGLPFFWKFIFGMAAVGILTGIIVCSYIFYSVFTVAHGEAVINLDEYQVNQNQTSIIYAYDTNGKLFELQRLHGKVNRIYVSMSEMPKHLRQAFVSLEDKRFYEHRGVDWIRFVAVFVKDHFRTGGSSITQQLVKNITGEREATFVRKFNEIGYALNLENHFTKDQILEAYLNTLYLGEGCYGVKTAAEKYFGKEVSELNLAESACLASITKAPYGYDPLVNPLNNRERQLDCLQYMLEQEKITQEQYNEAADYELIFTNSEKYKAANPEKIKEEKEEKETPQSFYVDFIIDTLYDDFMNEKGMSKQEATQKIYYGGLKIYAALDTNIQAILEDVYVNRRTFPDESRMKVQAQSAMTIMDYNGRVVAICGEAGKKSGNRCLNRAADSPRQPGSSIKPLTVYGPAIDSNVITWSSLYQDKAFAYQGKQWPKNQGGWGGGAYVTVQNAIDRSLNTVAARICYYDLKVETSYRYLTKVFKITTANADHDKAPAPMATGAMYKGVTTLEMSAAYATFGNGGKYYKPYCYYKVTNSDGSNIYFDNTLNEGEQVISAETAGVMCELLQTVSTASNGTGVPYKINGFQTMAKTGTTTDDFDRWFVGGTPYYVAAVWYGYDLNKTVANVYGNPSGKIFKEVMTRVHKKLPAKKFEISDKVEEHYFCQRTGKLASKSCYSTALGYYKADNVPGYCTSCAYRSRTTTSSGKKKSSGGSEKTTSIGEKFFDIFGR